MLNYGAFVSDVFDTMFIVVVFWEKTNEAELSPPMLRSIVNEDEAKVFKLQNETHLYVLFVSNYIC